MTVYLGLGTNLGDRWAHLRDAVEALYVLDADLRVSPVYETSPVGGPAQDDYLNCVVAIETRLSPRDLLALARRLEESAKRVRTIADGPRTLDVDVLLIGSSTVDLPELLVPHPRMYERAFVLAPLEDLDPTLVPPGWRESLLGGDLATQVRPAGRL